MSHPHRHVVVASTDVKNEHGVGMRVQIIQSYHGKPRWWLTRKYVQNGEPTGYRPPGDMEPSTQSESVMTGWLAHLPDLAWDKYAFQGGEKRVKKAEAAEAKFKGLVEAHLRSLGATPPDGPHSSWRLQTKAGPLRVTPFGGWIATRFEDLPLASKFVRGLGSSGKWNFHFDKIPGASDFEYFAGQLARLLPSAGDMRARRPARSSRRR